MEPLRLTLSQLRIQDYTVGWVCALPIELAAATAMLDERHQSLPHNDTDPSLYTLGRVGEHNVVLASLPSGQMGTNSAAVVATRMQLRFPSIRLGLMVGIGGGVPSAQADVRLGDVVISQPQSGYGGVVQYDFGRTGPDGRLVPTGFLSAPPPILLHAISKLRSNRYLNQDTLSMHMSIFGELAQFSRDEAGLDVLYEAAYSHIAGPTCDECRQDKKVERTPRAGEEMVIHYGTIASGNQVMKDGVTRDRISAELGGVLCFEMEAAGLMNSFPCLVIRGLCDYADSHKNKRWQPYAAAAAAACAKEILLLVPAAEASKLASADESPTLKKVDHQAWEKCQAALFVTDPRSDKENILSITGGIVPGTCEWIRSSERFTLWLQAPNSQFLWICGSPGTGKTALAVYLTQFISTAIPRDSELIFYFCHYAVPERRTATNVLRSLIWLLLHIRPDLYIHIWSDFRAMQEKLFTSSSAFETLWRIFTAMVKDPSLRSVYCVIDGLDECEGIEVGDLIRKLEALSTSVSEKAAPSFVFKVIILGRYDLIRASKELSTVPSLRLDLDAATEIRGDIEAVIFAKVQELSRLGSYTLQLQSTVEEAFRKGAKGTFLWVGLMAKDLKQKKTSEVARTLQALPTGLGEAYERLFLEISDDDKDFLAVVLRWVTVAVRPLHLSEIGLITALDCPQGLSLESVAQEHIDQYPSLLKSDSAGVVAFHHQFTREFLIREDVDVSPRLQHFMVNQAEAHLDIATFCLNYVIQNFQNFRHRWYRGVWDWEAPPRDSPLIDYASLYWPIHARNARSANSDLFSSSSSFWQEQSSIREAWLEYYQLKAKSPIMISADLTPFQTASYFGLNSFVIRLLHSTTWNTTVKQRNLLNEHSKDGFSPLVLAVLGSHSSTVELLLSEGADVNAVDPLLRRTALMQAAYLGDVPILKVLVRHGASIHTRDGSGTGAITIAAEQQNTNAMQYLETEAKVLFTAVGQYQRTVPEILDLKAGPLALGLNDRRSAASPLRDPWKVLLLGSAVVGKTSLVYRYFDKEFKDSTMATIGVDFRISTFDCDGRKVRCQVWDTAGAEAFRGIVPRLYPRADCFGLVFSLSDEWSFQCIKRLWQDELRMLDDRKEEPPGKRSAVVLGTGFDRYEKYPEVSRPEVIEWCSREGLPYIETSAKLNINVDVAFEAMFRQCVF